MKSSTGRWVTGDNFFDRTDELDQLEALVREGNHVSSPVSDGSARPAWPESWPLGSSAIGGR